mmetsp:Transcript_1076/g.6919  ORF Transcript_1076/g.6919 Transcript_1076/m.6919 type:complete len:223 (-) Transcript_1076:435-1103(-)
MYFELCGDLVHGLGLHKSSTDRRCWIPCLEEPHPPRHDRVVTEPSSKFCPICASAVKVSGTGGLVSTIASRILCGIVSCFCTGITTKWVILEWHTPPSWATRGKPIFTVSSPPAKVHTTVPSNGRPAFQSPVCSHGFAVSWRRDRRVPPRWFVVPNGIRAYGLDLLGGGGIGTAMEYTKLVALAWRGETGLDWIVCDACRSTPPCFVCKCGLCMREEESSVS